MSLPTILTEAILKPILKSFLATQDKCTDLNAVTETGAYSLYNPINGPVSGLYGVLLSIKMSSVVHLHLIFSQQGGLYFRVKWDTWRSWYRASTTAL